jgi:acetate kinase
MQNVILVCNAGSSSLKISIFLMIDNKINKQLSHILLEKKDNEIIFHLNDDQTNQIIETKKSSKDPIVDMINMFLLWWNEKKNMNLIATGHRVVHGGNIFSSPVIVTDEIISQIEKLIPLDPLHQPYNLAALKIFFEKYPSKKHIACFDTAFHMTQSKLAKSFSLPKKFADKSICKYGFHGLSYQYVSQNFKIITKLDLPEKTIIAHLGSGASLCALHNGKSIASSMGFSVLEGLMMATRSGSIDPGVILYLLEHEKMTVTEVSNLLYKNSGLLGVSGESADMRVLIESQSQDSQFAIDLFIYKIQQEIGKLVFLLAGLDALIFTAGIGEHSPIIREKICRTLSWFGCELDEIANSENKLQLNNQHSKIQIFVIPTDEEKTIAMNTISKLCNSSDK